MMIQKFKSFQLGKRLRVAGAVGAGMVSGVAANAQGVSYPGGVPYDTLTTTFKDALTPILVGVLPICVAMMAIWIGPRVFKGMLHAFLGH